MNPEVEKIQASELAKKLDYYCTFYQTHKNMQRVTFLRKLNHHHYYVDVKDEEDGTNNKYRNILIGLGKNRIFSFQLL